MKSSMSSEDSRSQNGIRTKIIPCHGSDYNEFPIQVRSTESFIAPDLCEEYINKELNEELPVLQRKFSSQNFFKVIL